MMLSLSLRPQTRVESVSQCSELQGAGGLGSAQGLAAGVTEAVQYGLWGSRAPPSLSFVGT
eukprot:77772-Rhodomonas_salina.1